MIRKLAPSQTHAVDLSCQVEFCDLSTGNQNCQWNDLPTLDMQVVTVDDPSQLKAHVPQWRRLSETAVQANAFYEPEFLIPALQNLQTAREVQVVLVTAQPRVNPDGPPVMCGLFPIRCRRTWHGMPAKTVELWSQDHIYLTTPLIRKDALVETWTTFFKWVQENCGAKLIYFPRLGTDGRLKRTLLEWMGKHQTPHFSKSQYHRAVLLGQHSAEHCLQVGLSRKKRHDLRRLRRQIDQHGLVRFETLDAASDLEMWIAEFLELERRGWKGNAGTAMSSTEVDRRFLIELTRGLYQNDKLAMHRLTVNEQTVAMKLNLLTGRGAFAFKIAFDERFAKYSPGTLLEIENIKWMHRQNKVVWMDSCASADHPMINRLWRDRRGIESLVVSTDQRGADWRIALMPLCRWLKHKLCRKKPIT